MSNQAKKTTQAHNEEKSGMSGKEATQLKSVPPVTNAVDNAGARDARNMAAPTSPADDQKTAGDEADRVYEDHSTNPSVGGGANPANTAPNTTDKKNAPPQRQEVEQRKTEAKAGKQFLRVKASHPRGMFRIGRHTLTRQFEEYDLNDQEAKELASEGATAWVEMGDESKAKQDAQMQAEIKRAQGSSADDI